MQGKVNKFDKGYGFIDGNDGVTYFVHQTKILMNGFRKLEPGQRVEFDAVKTERGWTAENVKAID